MDQPTSPTNVRPGYLNYLGYTREQYDDDIARSIPGYKELHDHLSQIVKDEFCGRAIQILELGPGTGLSAERVLRHVHPSSTYIGIEFSGVMGCYARVRISERGWAGGTIVEADYAIHPFPSERDLVLSVIGIHHQGTDEAKKAVFRKVYDCLRRGGLFLFGDSMTFRDPHTTALNEALHYHHLVANARDNDSLRDWAYHHKFQNALSSAEDQRDWLREVGFHDVHVVYQKLTTVFVSARK